MTTAQSKALKSIDRSRWHIRDKTSSLSIRIGNSPIIMVNHDGDVLFIYGDGKVVINGK